MNAAKGLEFDEEYLQGWEEGLFPKSLSGFQTVPCPTCNGTGKVYDYDEDHYGSQDLINPIRFDRSGAG